MGDTSLILSGISSKGIYALRAIFELSLRTPGKAIRIADIAKRQNIPQKFLELILSELKRGGFVESMRGAEGGYMLSRLPETITIGEVLQYVEGTKTLHHRKKRDGENPFAKLWDQIDTAISEIVDNVHFSDLARDWFEQENMNSITWDI